MRGLSQPPSGPLPPVDVLAAGRVDARRLLRPPPLAAAHHHCLLTPPLAAAMVAHGTGALRAASTRDPSVRPPSRACRAATPSLSHGRRWVEVSVGAGVSWHGATRSCDRPGTGSTDPASLLRPGTACSPGARSPPPADGYRG